MPFRYPSDPEERRREMRREDRLIKLMAVVVLAAFTLAAYGIWRTL
jgi:hypothetical protein